MEIYLVGGAIRDQILGEPVRERDYVVVGSTPQEMIALGYKQVGKDFPVFLHPKTHEEYALARTENKTGKGYTKFSFHFEKDISLEEDLKRRDLTINAIAQTKDGQLIDPFGGQKDLKNRVLRHISPSFTEDPLRVLRVARFASRFGDFYIHPETMDLMKKIVSQGEIEALTKERSWKEITRAIKEQYPEIFFTILEECGALKIILPEIYDFLPRALSRLKIAKRLSLKGCVRFAAIFYDLDLITVKKLCKRINAPKKYLDLLITVVKNKDSFQSSLNLNAEDLLAALLRIDAIRRNERFHNFLLACESTSQIIPSPELERLKLSQEILIRTPIKYILNTQKETEAIKESIKAARIAKLKTFLEQI